ISVTAFSPGISEGNTIVNWLQSISFLNSIRLMWPRGTVDRTVLPKRQFWGRISSAYVACPVTFAIPSFRSTLVPMVRNVATSCASCVFFCAFCVPIPVNQSSLIHHPNRKAFQKILKALQILKQKLILYIHTLKNLIETGKPDL